MRMNRRTFGCVMGVLLVLGAVASSRPASGDESYHLVGARVVYTLVNLHPDETRKRLYSVNYQQAGLLPRCTRVKIESVSSNEMKFLAVDGGREYAYIFHNSMRDSVPKHLDKYFGTSCDKSKVQKMSKIDQEGIKTGQATEGMTKQGVILAIGYPPEHVTPTTEGNAWRYWKNRFGTMVVHFADGKVVRIQK